MSNKTNYHSHTSFCDGKAPMEDFIKVAIREGFTSYGVSSHAPLPYHTDWTMDMERLPAYMAEFARLKEIYGEEEIDLYVGLEIDYLNETHNPAMPLFADLSLDYRIGSVHLVHSPEGKLVDTDTDAENFQYILKNDFKGDLKKFVEEYFLSSMKMIETGGFDIVGHADKISMNTSVCEPSLLQSDWYKEKVAELFSFIAEKGLMMEVNTKAFERKNMLFPNKENLQLVKDLNIPVMVNSDAHYPELINAGRDYVLNLLKEIGFKTVRQLSAGEWIDVIID